MDKQIILNHFLSAIIMGEEIFLIYKDKAQDEKLKNIIEDFINSLINQKKEMEKYISKILNAKILDNCIFSNIEGARILDIRKNGGK